MRNVRIILLSIAAAVLGNACKTGNEAPTPSTTLVCNGVTTHGWEAWVNLMPGPGADKPLIVKGTASLTSGGWKITLWEKVPQGINPRILMLDLTVTPPSGPATQPVFEQEISFRKPNAAGQYDSVQILCQNGKSILLKVKEVH